MLAEAVPTELPRARARTRAPVALGVALAAAWCWLGFAGAALATDLGRDIVLHGSVSGRPGCAACHMENGAGMPEAGIPRLAGLDAGYIDRQLQAFAAGTRRNVVMQPYARLLDPAARHAVAAYFAALAPVPEEDAPEPDPAAVASGAALAAHGNMRAGVMACAGCHGPAERGLAGFSPILAGQSAPYVEAQLRAWHAGIERDPGAAPMLGVAHGLDDAQIAELAAYLSSLPPAPGQAATAQGQAR